MQHSVETSSRYVKPPSTWCLTVVHSVFVCDNNSIKTYFLICFQELNNHDSSKQCCFSRHALCRIFVP